MALCYNRRQDNTMQYTTIEYNKITHIRQNNPQTQGYSQHQITKKEIKTYITHYITLTLLEPTVDETILHTTGCTKQSLNLTIQYSNTHISPRLTPQSKSLLSYTIHVIHRFLSLLLTAFS